MDPFIRGQWLSLNRILDLLNTFDDKVIDKTDLYKEIMKLRPIYYEKEELDV